MTSFGYNVTIQTLGSEEQEFFRSYDSPAIESLSCSEGTVTLKPFENSFDHTAQELTFTFQQIEELKGYPMRFFEGKVSEPGGKKFPEPHHYVVGALVGLIAWVLYRGFRPKSLREVES